MGCKELSVNDNSSLPHVDFTFHFDQYQTGERVTVSAFTDRAKKYATRDVTGTKGEIASAKAGMQFEATLLCIEPNWDSFRHRPLAVLSTEDGDHIVFQVEFHGTEPRLNENAWGMITSPLELVRFEKTADQLRELLLSRRSIMKEPVQR